MLKRVFRLIYFLCCILSATINTNAFGSRIDSLQHNLKIKIADTARVTTLYALGFEYCMSDSVLAVQYINQAYSISKKIGYEKGIRELTKNRGRFLYTWGNYKDAIDEFQSYLIECESVVDISPRELIKAYLYLGAAYYSTGMLFPSLDNYNKGLEVSESAKDTSMVGMILNNLGNIYLNIGKSDLSLNSYYRALAYTNDMKRRSMILSNIAGIHAAKKNIAFARDFYNQAIEISSSNKESIAYLNAIVGLCDLYVKISERDSFYLYYNIAINGLKTKRDVNMYLDLQRICIDYLMENKEYDGAVRVLKEITEYIDAENEYNPNLYDIYKNLSECYFRLGKINDAYSCMKKSNYIRDSIIDPDHDSLIQLKDDISQKNYNKLLNLSKINAQLKLNEQEKKIRTQKLYIFFAFVGILILIFIMWFIIKKNREVKAANDEIQRQKNIIESKNKDITDSINYARHIQDSVLPGISKVNRIFPENFVFYKPRDIISGDLYWVAEFDRVKIIAVADCTGHGVPGAILSVMMSILGYDIVFQLLKEDRIIKASQALFDLNIRASRVLGQNKATSNSYDGMDIALCIIDTQSGIMSYSGANRPLILVRNNELLEFAPSKCSVAGGYMENKSFAEEEISLNKGDVIYLFSDGFQDQFGGEEGKKYKSSRFKRLLLKINTFSMDEQASILSTEFETWKGANEQVDDICVVGIKIV